jgi:hypothetical protein
LDLVGAIRRLAENEIRAGHDSCLGIARGNLLGSGKDKKARPVGFYHSGPRAFGGFSETQRDALSEAGEVGGDERETVGGK